MNENVLKDIGVNIIFHRRLIGVTQAVCARNCGIGVALLSRIERGLNVENVPLTTYIKIAESLSVPMTDLLKTSEVRVTKLCVRRKL
ncbi:MAG: helix-turn-helix transcriptional regulator [Phascolarctobacterium sp.]|nr:helix-turn-helix transcriptional regulator [Phascolarctobacterium sp.]